MRSSTVTNWRDAFAVYTNARVIAMLFLGFAAGLPLLLVFSTLSAWLSDLNISRSAIGFFGWVGVTYSIKVFWAPVIDRVSLPLLTRWLGSRRSWILVAQLSIIVSLSLMSQIDPQNNLILLALLSVWVAFSSATQDVAIDAYRIEAVVEEYQAAMSATYIFGYRIAMLIAGAGALYIADVWSWAVAYSTMACFMVVGVVTVLVIVEPCEHKPPPIESKLGGSRLARLRHWLLVALVAPFTDFFKRNGRFAWIVLAFIALYRLSDIMMGIMANPFYLDLGFTKSDIASIGKVFGLLMTLLGTFIGGVIVARFGVLKPLLAGAVMVALTNVLFAQLAQIGPDKTWLAIVISADNISAGFANATFIAYLSGLTNKHYTATQYALFSSLMTLPGKLFSGFSGVIVDASGYYEFFLYAAVLGIPAIILSLIVIRYQRA